MARRRPTTDEAVLKNRNASRVTRNAQQAICSCYELQLHVSGVIDAPPRRRKDRDGAETKRYASRPTDGARVSCAWDRTAFGGTDARLCRFVQVVVRTRSRAADEPSRLGSSEPIAQFSSLVTPQPHSKARTHGDAWALWQTSAKRFSLTLRSIASHFGPASLKLCSCPPKATNPSSWTRS